MPSIDLSGLDASLRVRRDGARSLFIKKMIDGWGRLQGFQKIRTTDEAVLGSLLIESLLQPGAKGTFNPKENAIKAEARIGKVRPGKVDLLITQPLAQQLENTYFAQIEGHQAKNPEDFMFADHIWQMLITRAGKDIMQAVWNGSLNSAGTNPVDVVNGLIKLIDDDIASDDIPESMILTHSAADFHLNEDNIVEELKKMTKIYQNELPDYAYEPATMRLSPARVSDYEFAMMELVGEKRIYNQFNQPTLLWAPHIKLEATPELAGSDFIGLAPDENFVFQSDRTEDGIVLDTDYSKRDRSIAIVGDIKFASNYHRSDLIVTNDLRARPAGTGK